jgi:hypothetical protein
LTIDLRTVSAFKLIGRAKKGKLDMGPFQRVSVYSLIPGKSSYLLLCISLLPLFTSWAWNLPRKFSFHLLSDFLHVHSEVSLFAWFLPYDIR